MRAMNTSAATRPLLPSDHQPGRALERAAFATALSVAANQSAERVAQRWPHDLDVVRAVLSRAAVDGGTTGGWASELAVQATSHFLSGLNPQAAMSAVIARGLKLRLGEGIISL